MNRRGFFGRMAGLLGLPFIATAPVSHDTGADEITITTGGGVTRRYCEVHPAGSTEPVGWAFLDDPEEDVYND